MPWLELHRCTAIFEGVAPVRRYRVLPAKVHRLGEHFIWCIETGRESTLVSILSTALAAVPERAGYSYGEPPPVLVLQELHIPSRVLGLMPRPALPPPALTENGEGGEGRDGRRSILDVHSEVLWTSNSLIEVAWSKSAMAFLAEALHESQVQLGVLRLPVFSPPLPPALTLNLPKKLLPSISFDSPSSASGPVPSVSVPSVDPNANNDSQHWLAVVVHAAPDTPQLFEGAGLLCLEGGDYRRAMALFQHSRRKVATVKSLALALDGFTTANFDW
jgi:hypothetical protein